MCSTHFELAMNQNQNPFLCALDCRVWAQSASIPSDQTSQKDEWQREPENNSSFAADVLSIPRQVQPRLTLDVLLQSSTDGFSRVHVMQLAATVLAAESSVMTDSFLWVRKPHALENFMPWKGLWSKFGLVCVCHCVRCVCYFAGDLRLPLSVPVTFSSKPPTTDRHLLISPFLTAH